MIATLRRALSERDVKIEMLEKQIASLEQRGRFVLLQNETKVHVKT